MATFNEITTKKNQRSKWRFLKYFLGLVFVLVITGTNGVLLYLHYQNQNLAPTVLESKTNEERAQEIITAFGNLYQIPEGENPTVILVTDADKLRETQPEFYAMAKNDDHLIVLLSAKLAFIYRTSENKIINVSQVSVDNEAAANPETTQ